MYYSRYIEKNIERTLKSSGAILVCGPKFCGKTTTCMRYQKSSVRLNTEQAIQLARLNPLQMLKGDEPRLIDEWQTAPDIWNHVKASLDEDYRFGRFILTGSSTPVDKTRIYHSGAGRITPVLMRTMSLYESQESKGTVSLQGLFNEPYLSEIDLNEACALEDIAFFICRGGWPIALVDDRDQALDITRNYYNSLFVFENSENERFRNKKPEVLKQMVRSYARNISTEAPYQTVLEDLRVTNDSSMDRKTFNDYMEALKDLYIIEEMPAWNPNIRSKTAIRSTPTRHFVDTSIACRALNIMPMDLMKDLRTLGLLFEDMAVRDLKIYTSVIGGEVRHYRDNTGLECDAVIHLEDGRWAAIEIKLGAKSLIRLKQKLEEKSDEAKPEFLAVLTATGPLYQRDDGVMVIPLNCLKA